MMPTIKNNINEIILVTNPPATNHWKKLVLPVFLSLAIKPPIVIKAQTKNNIIGANMETSVDTFINKSVGFVMFCCKLYGILTTFSCRD